MYWTCAETDGLGNHECCDGAQVHNELLNINRKQPKLIKAKANPSRGEKCYSSIGGVNRLTEKAIMSIQGHYCAAIRENNTLESIKSAIWAIYHHRSGNHTSCPDWCAGTNGDLAKANKHRLPAFACNIMKPIFTRLSSALQVRSWRNTKRQRGIPSRSPESLPSHSGIYPINIRI